MRRATKFAVLHYMLILCCKPSIDKITHNYFERDHSYMEGDSVHATIENATKRIEVYSPEDWVAAIKTAK